MTKCRICPKCSLIRVDIGCKCHNCGWVYESKKEEAKKDDI